MRKVIGDQLPAARLLADAFAQWLACAADDDYGAAYGGGYGDACGSAGLLDRALHADT